MLRHRTLCEITLDLNEGTRQSFSFLFDWRFASFAFKCSLSPKLVFCSWKVWVWWYWCVFPFKFSSDWSVTRMSSNRRSSCWYNSPWSCNCRLNSSLAILRLHFLLKLSLLFCFRLILEFIMAYILTIYIVIINSRAFISNKWAVRPLICFQFWI